MAAHSVRSSCACLSTAPLNARTVSTSCSVSSPRTCSVRPRVSSCGAGIQHSKVSSSCQVSVPTFESGRQGAEKPFQGCQRRQFISAGMLALLSLPTVTQSASATSVSGPVTQEPSIALQVDEINACSYEYPLRIPQTSFDLKWVESRKPERYSSAAPLSPDARQRIVSERLDFKNNVVISVAIGPPSSIFLKSNDTSTWDAKSVARSVLSDKSTARMTTGQRVAEIAVLDAHTEVIDGVRYWYYEYLTQKSPTNNEYLAEVYRHSMAASAEREGYLYSINASALDKTWDTMGPVLKQTVTSFHLTPPTDEYVPPYKDPWRFW